MNDYKNDDVKKMLEMLKEQTNDESSAPIDTQTTDSVHTDEEIKNMLKECFSAKQESPVAVMNDYSFDEIEDFVKIQEELKQISMTVSALQLWSEQMIANGNIDINKINEIKESN